MGIYNWDGHEFAKPIYLLKNDIYSLFDYETNC